MKDARKAKGILCVVLMAAAFGRLNRLEAFAQTGSSTISVDYDRFKDKTTVQTKEVDIGDLVQMGYRNGEHVVIHPDALFFWFKIVGSYSFAGQQKTRVDSMNLFFMTTSRTWRFLNDTDLNVIADNERIPLGKMVRRGKAESLLRVVSVRETLGATIPSSTMSKIANAKKVEMRVGSIEFEFGDNERQALRELVKSAASD